MGTAATKRDPKGWSSLGKSWENMGKSWEDMGKSGKLGKTGEENLDFSERP
jgi:hypothetical protein